ncbi:MAG: discoidin domain-containing protein [Maribacter sp.]|uniref:discoidin domain-containing protein n=1 Tax=Maribacter sp. TaxID=1897614 RepID=UPI003C7667B4
MENSFFIKIPKFLFLGILYVWGVCFASCSKEEAVKKPSVENTIPPTKDTTTVEQPVIIQAPHAIEIKRLEGTAKFWNKAKDEEFVMRGVNYIWLVAHNGIIQDRFFAPGNFDASRVKADFKHLVANGFNTIRIFMDTCNDGPDCIGNISSPGLNPNYIENMAQTLQIAYDEGIFLLLTSNDLPDTGGYWDISNSGANEQFEGYRNAHYLTPKGIESAQKYWEDLLKALYDRGAPFESILGWSILNEQWYFKDKPPFSLSSQIITTANGKSYDMASEADRKSMAVEGMVHYIAKAREIITKYDSNALVTMGFFNPNYPNPIGLGDFRYVETADLLYQADLDFFDFHAYPGDDPLYPLVENFGMVGYESKPIILGEYGAFIDRYPVLDDAIETMQSYQAEACSYGFDGWLYWGMYRGAGNANDTSWGFMDENQEMLNAMAPINYPDPCDENFLLPVNVALNKPVTASENLSTETPEMAVDGDVVSQWGSGQNPTQWIEIDLEMVYDLYEITLRVAQYPSGNTTHIVEASIDGTAWDTLQTFSGETKEDDVLVHELSTVTPYRFIRITTTDSPSWVSWKEIEVWGK